MALINAHLNAGVILVVTVLKHWSQFVPNMLTDIRRHEALHHLKTDGYFTQ